ncbi:iron-sulfur protein NUBPL [Tanacetum coccineum]
MRASFTFSSYSLEHTSILWIHMCTLYIDHGIHLYENVQIPLQSVQIFGKRGARKTADEMGLRFVGEIPLEEDIRNGSDEGVHVVVSHPNSTVSKAYGDVADKIISKLHELAADQHSRPEVLVIIQQFEELSFFIESNVLSPFGLM